MRAHDGPACKEPCHQSGTASMPPSPRSQDQGVAGEAAVSDDGDEDEAQDHQYRPEAERRGLQGLVAHGGPGAHAERQDVYDKTDSHHHPTRD